MAVPQIKSMIVGHVGAGITSLILRHCHGIFPDSRDLRDCEMKNWSYNNRKLVEHNGRSFIIELEDGKEWDTDSGRNIVYGMVDVFIILFEITENEERFAQIHSYWWAEINRYCPKVPIVLVGSKVDSRGQEDIKTIATEEGQAMAEKIGAAKYMEVSSLENRGVTELFEEVVVLGFEHSVAARAAKEKRKKKCTIL